MIQLDVVLYLIFDFNHWTLIYNEHCLLACEIKQCETEQSRYIITEMKNPNILVNSIQSKRHCIGLKKNRILNFGKLPNLERLKSKSMNIGIKLN